MSLESKLELRSSIVTKSLDLTTLGGVSWIQNTKYPTSIDVRK